MKQLNKITLSLFIFFISSINLIAQRSRDYKALPDDYGVSGAIGGGIFSLFSLIIFAAFVMFALHIANSIIGKEDTAGGIIALVVGFFGGSIIGVISQLFVEENTSGIIAFVSGTIIFFWLCILSAKAVNTQS